MNLLKQLDQYLLRYYPNIWITKIHWVLSIGMLTFGLVFMVNSFVIGYDTHDPIPDSIIGTTCISILVAIGLVYWFVFQSRHNVEKSGGRLSMAEEYLNYFSYFLVFVIAAYVIISIPLSNEFKLKNAMTSAELRQDITSLNMGNSIVNNKGFFKQKDGGYEFEVIAFSVLDYYEWGYERQKIVFMTSEEVDEVVQKYILAYNKYTNTPIEDTPAKIVEERLIADLENGYNYDQYSEYGYYYRSSAIGKVNLLYRLIEENRHEFILEKAFHFVLFAITGLLALLVWIFKQVHWKYFVYGLLALLIVPIIVGIITTILEEILRYHFEPENFILGSILVGYAVTMVLLFRAYIMETTNHTSVVVAMFLQMYIPFAILIVMLFFFEKKLRYLDDSGENLLYYASWGLGLLSILVFKLFYQRMRILPSRK